VGVRFILGRAGSGKSRRVFEEMGEQLRANPEGPPLILLVPEQMTQAADRMFATQFGGTVRAQSLSFRRLAFRVLQETGGAARLHIDDVGKKMLLYKIARNQSQQLRSFRRMTEGSGWIDAALEWYAECKRYMVDAEALRRTAAEERIPEVLSDKLHDLSLLVGGMEKELEGKYVDSEDYLSLLAEKSAVSQIIGSANIWVDGFHGFTPLELQVMGRLFQHAANVTVALTLDRDVAEEEPLDELALFYPTARTLQQLKAAAREGNVPVQEALVLRESDGSRFAHSPSLAAMEQAFTAKENGEPLPDSAVRPGEGVSIVSAANPRTEVEAAARDILRQVSSGHARWRDISVFVRNWEGYGEVIAAVFAEYGIPHFLDQKRPVVHHPLSELIRSALDVVHTRWSYDAVFRAVKTDLLFPRGSFPNDAAQRYAMDKLENVVLEYGVKGSRWTDGKPWRLNANIPLEGDAAAHEERMRAEEDRVNRWRAMVVSPLSALEKRLKKASTIREQAEALYRFLEEVDASGTLMSWRETAEQAGEMEKAKEHEQLWDRVMDTLDQLVELVGEEPADLELFSGMVEAGLDSIRLGLVPPALDQVLVGSLDRTRVFGVKRLYLLGVNDGVIPMRPKEGGMITEAERERLNDAGLTLAPDNQRRFLDERFMLYNALFLPSEGLWISYALSDPEGASQLPSEWVGKIRSIAPAAALRFVTAEMPAGAEGEEEVLERLSRPERALSDLMPQLRRWKRGEAVSGVWWAAYNWLVERPYWREKLQQLLPSLDYKNEEIRISEETAAQLYGEVFRSSVSRLEKFAACPFAHFAAYGLRLTERRLYRLEAPDIGQLYHAALSQLAKKLEAEGRAWSDLAEGEAMELAYTTVEELAPKLMSEILFSSNRHKYMTRKLKRVVGETANAISGQASRSGYRQAAAELSFGEGGQMPALKLTLPNGAVMELQGRIDRIDRAAGERGGVYLRVVDYKSREHRLNLSDVYYGLSLQLLAYADAAVTHAPEWLGEEAEIAGALYFHVHQPTLSLANAAAREEASAEQFKSYKMAGLVLDDDEAARLMDTALDSGISPVVPLEWKKDGTLSARSKAVDRAKWKRLRRFVRTKMTELGADAACGVIAVSPYRNAKKETPCTFCQYKTVCAFDPELADNEYRFLPKLSDEDVWERMEREEGEE